MLRLAVLCLLIMLAVAVHAENKPRALVVDGFPSDAKLTESIAAQIESAGYDVTTAGPDKLDSLSGVNLLVLVDAAHMPSSTGKPIQDFLQGGGDIIALRAPIWQTSLVKLGDKWVPSDDYLKETAAVPPTHLLFDFKPGSIDTWNRTANPEAEPSIYEAGAQGPAPGTYALHCKIPNLTGWDNIAARDLENPFPKGHTLTVFSAKGGPKTTQIAVEWCEKDGSRWIATVPVDQTWRRYVLKPQDFKYWHSAPNRGGRGDRFKPENASTLSVGLAFSHTGPFGGEQEFWVGPFGTSDESGAVSILETKPDVQPMDLLTPAYKFFECTGVSKVTSINGADLPASGTILSPHPRPEGRGYGKGRNWRFIPLATARTAEGEWRGHPAAMMIHSQGSSYNGGVWASFGYQDTAAYNSTELLSFIKDTAQRINRGLFFLEAGTNFFTYSKSDPFFAGAEIVNLSVADSTGVEVEWKLTEAKSGQILWYLKQSHNPKLNGTIRAVVNVDKIDDSDFPWLAEGMIMTVGLLQDGRVIDKISHEVNRWQPKAKKQFVTYGGGQFLLNGKPWKAHGVNFMPSSGIGTEDGEYFEHWIGAQPYDPAIIQRDLERIKGLGMNAISAFVYTGHHKAGNVLDLLCRCEKLGIKVNLSLRPGTPMDFLWEGISQIIERDRLWENDTVFAYDLAWEPSFGGHQSRKQWDREWEEWIVERYGSIENAEADWAYPVPREDGKVTNPSDGQTVADGEWKKMVVAYRRFLDDLLYRYYNGARMLVRSIDPNHLVSFRMSECGNPTYNWDAFMPYDLAGIAPAVDFLAPEAYGRISDQWEKVKPGWFEREYSRWAAPEKPMIWAEAGVSTWDNSWMKNTDEKLRYQGDHYEQFYKMLISSRANGVFFWWYPGGFRYGENSDFGLINPDGSDRPSTEAVRRNAAAFMTAVDQPVIDTWIEIDRDADPRGIYGVYIKAEKEFWSLIDQGKKPGLKTQGTGTTSVDCPMVCVGNTRFDGGEPLKYLNSAFDTLEIKDASGKWIEAKDGIEITVDPANPVLARTIIRNLGEAKWISANGKGMVELVCHIGFGKNAFVIPSDVPKHQTVKMDNVEIVGKGIAGPATIRIFIRARDRGDFGESVKLKIIPAYLH